MKNDLRDPGVDQAGAEFGGESAAVLAQNHALVAQRRAGLYQCDALGQDMAIGWKVRDRVIHACQFVLGIAQQFAGPRVGEDEPALGVEYNYPVGRLLDELPVFHFARLERLLGARFLAGIEVEQGESEKK